MRSVSSNWLQQDLHVLSLKCNFDTPPMESYGLSGCLCPASLALNLGRPAPAAKLVLCDLRSGVIERCCRLPVSVL